MFCGFFPPEQLLSDQGKQFESELISEICKLLQIKKTQTTPYHLQCNGLVELFNCTLMDMLATTTKNHLFYLEEQLPCVFMVVCISPFWLHSLLLDVWAAREDASGSHVWDW